MVQPPRNGTIYCEDGGPSIIVYHASGQIKYMEWHNAVGKLHREGNPAYILYDITGRIVKQVHYINGVKQEK